MFIKIFAGEKLMQDPLSQVDHIQSKCEELRRTSALLLEKIQKRNLLLTKARELMDRIDKVSWNSVKTEFKRENVSAHSIHNHEFDVILFIHSLSGNYIGILNLNF